MVDVWLIVPAWSSTLYGKVLHLILKKTSRLAQAVVFFRRHFLCGALLCNLSSAEHEGISTHTCPTGMFSRTLYAQHPATMNLHISPRFSPTSTPLYSSIIRLYPQNPVFEIVHGESVKDYLHIHTYMYNGNVQQNPLCVESCVTINKEFSISPRLSPTIFYSDAISVLLRAHLCTAVYSTRRKPCVRNCSRECEGLYNENVQQNPLCAASCVTKDIPISPRFSPTIFYRDANSVLLLAHLCTTVLLVGSMRRTLCSKWFMMRA